MPGPPSDAKMQKGRIWPGRAVFLHIFELKKKKKEPIDNLNKIKGVPQADLFRGSVTGG